jgi:AAA+ superfamily predicted ATPase
MPSKKNQHFIAFTEIERGMSRDEIKQRLIKAFLNKGISVKSGDIISRPNANKR